MFPSIETIHIKVVTFSIPGHDTDSADVYLITVEFNKHRDLFNLVILHWSQIHPQKVSFENLYGYTFQVVPKNK